MLFAAAGESLPQVMAVWLALVQLAVSLGVVTAFGVACKHLWNRHRWRMFKESIREWMRVAADSEVEHPKLMRDDDWKALVEIRLTESYFSPFEIQSLIDLAVITAKGIIEPELL